MITHQQISPEQDLRSIMKKTKGPCMKSLILKSLQSNNSKHIVESLKKKLKGEANGCESSSYPYMAIYFFAGYKYVELEKGVTFRNQMFRNLSGSVNATIDKNYSSYTPQYKSIMQRVIKTALYVFLGIIREQNFQDTHLRNQLKKLQFASELALTKKSTKQSIEKMIQIIHKYVGPQGICDSELSEPEEAQPQEDVPVPIPEGQRRMEVMEENEQSELRSLHEESYNFNNENTIEMMMEQGLFKPQQKEEPIFF